MSKPPKIVGEEKFKYGQSKYNDFCVHTHLPHLFKNNYNDYSDFKQNVSARTYTKRMNTFFRKSLGSFLLR